MSMIAEEYHNIKHRIVIFEKDGFYSKSIATQIAQAFPKGSNERAYVIRALQEEGRIASECSVRMQLEWSSTPLESNDKEQCCLATPTRPVIDQRWKDEGGRKRKVNDSGEWMGSLFMDLHPVETSIVTMEFRASINSEIESPISTLDLYSIAQRIDICRFCGKGVPLIVLPKAISGAI